jgi:hypothetical protein
MGALSRTMTRTDLHLRPFTPELLPQVAGLLRHLWSGDVASNQRIFQWKYLENPHRACSPGIVALLRDRVVGFRGYFATPWIGPGQIDPIRILCPGDTCVEPACRHWGLSVAMGEMASRYFATDFPLFLNTTTTHPSLPGYRKLGFLPLATKAYHSAYRIANLLRYIGTHSQRPSLESVRSRCCEERDFVVTTDPRADQMATMAQRQREPWSGLRPLRTAAYFHWRFRHPRRTYFFYYAYAGGEMQGYAIVGLSPNLRRGYLLDFLDVDGASVRALVARMLRRRDVDILSISTASLGSTSLDWQSAGFKATGMLRRLERRRTGELPLLVRPVAPDFDERHWLVAGVDTRDIRNWQYREMVSDAF